MKRITGLLGSKKTLGLFVLVSILFMASLGAFVPVRTAKGLLTDSGLPIYIGPISIDAARVATMNGTSTLAKAVEIYDISTASSTSFAGPNAIGNSMDAIIFGDKIVAVGNITSNLFPFTATISYCVLPHASSLQPCGSWHQLANRLPQYTAFNSYGPPTIHGDLVAWWTVNGLSYYRFSSNLTETVPFTPPFQPVGLSTNGEIIAFTLANDPTHANYCGNLEYIDTTGGSDSPVNTGLYNCPLGGIVGSTSFSQFTISFMDNSTGHNRIRYYDLLRNQASSGGQGPLGNITNVEAQSIWGDRIVFTASETSVNFDCNGDGSIKSNEFCLDYWNIRAPSYVATTLAAKAAPSLSYFNSPVAIYDKTIVFRGTNGDLQYVIVPMQGDVNLDGVVDNTDKTDVTNCLNQVLKGTIC